MSNEGTVLLKTLLVGGIGGLVLSAAIIFVVQMMKPDPVTKTYQIACMIWTPEGPLPTIQTEATNAKITSFGVIKSDEGLYIPATNELCMVKEIK